MPDTSALDQAVIEEIRSHPENVWTQLHVAWAMTLDRTTPFEGRTFKALPDAIDQSLELAHLNGVREAERRHKDDLESKSKRIDDLVRALQLAREACRTNPAFAEALEAANLVLDGRVG